VVVMVVVVVLLFRFVVFFEFLELRFEVLELLGCFGLSFSCTVSFCIMDQTG
jgi:hypothetical protein